jgi:SM-20-related protein
MASDFKPELNAGLDVETAKAQFAFQRRVHLPDFFAPATAKRIHTCLMTETPWGFAYLDEGTPRMMHRRELEGITRARSDRIAKTITAQVAALRPSYGYFCYPMSVAAAHGWNPELDLHPVFQFLNGPDLLTLVRDITGKADINGADAQATLFSHQHFASVQTDMILGSAASPDRQIAYVIQLTKDWQEDWGGYLQFYNRQGDISHGCKPSFNSLTLFELPQRHSVSYVAPFAAVGRLMVSGCFSGTSATS